MAEDGRALGDHRGQHGFDDDRRRPHDPAARCRLDARASPASERRGMGVCRPRYRHQACRRRIVPDPRRRSRLRAEECLARAGERLRDRAADHAVGLYRRFRASPRPATSFRKTRASEKRRRRSRRRRREPRRNRDGGGNPPREAEGSQDENESVLRRGGNQNGADTHTKRHDHLGRSQDRRSQPRRHSHRRQQDRRDRAGDHRRTTPRSSTPPT